MAIDLDPSSIDTIITFWYIVLANQRVYNFGQSERIDWRTNWRENIRNFELGQSARFEQHFLARLSRHYYSTLFLSKFGITPFAVRKKYSKEIYKHIFSKDTSSDSLVSWKRVVNSDGNDTGRKWLLRI